MKGISHFMSGVAMATFFPWTLKAAEEGNPMYFILGGAFGIMPDTLDFKFYRFFYKHDIYIEPGPQTDPQEIAEKIAEGVALSLTKHKMVKVKLCTIRLGADYWQQYVVRFDSKINEVMVQFGPVVNTGQVPVPNTIPDKPMVGRAKLKAKLVQTYDAVSTVDIFDGPTFGFESLPDNKSSELHFLPWHREWSHSYTCAALCAFIILLLLGWQAALVVFFAFGVHVAEDQMGFMGSNLFFPFTKRRAQGLHLMRSGDAMPNFMTVWFSALIIFWNAYRYQTTLTLSFSLFELVLYGALLPGVTLYVLLHIADARKPLSTPGSGDMPVASAVAEGVADTSTEWGDGDTP